MPHATIKRALISVSNKEGLIPFARQLHELGIELISTGGTCSALLAADIPAIEVAELTSFPEIMDGRVKTLHPKIHGGILGKRTLHADVAEEHAIGWIDLVVVNLYPFVETVQKPSTRFEEAIEQIDIGGPAMIRSAAKNMEFVTVVVDPADYAAVLEALRADQGIDLPRRKSLACKAFQHTAYYDALIHDYLTSQLEDQPVEFPKTLCLPLTQALTLRYGENPNQKACAYTLGNHPSGLLHATSHQGKALSYNNLLDADAALTCVRDFSEPACVIIKHANPCGIAQAETPLLAFNKAFAADSKSAFGGIVALNRTCEEDVALAISKLFVEVILAPDFSESALRILATKPNFRVLSLNINQGKTAQHPYHQWYYQTIDGGLLIQEKLTQNIEPDTLKTVTQRKPSDEELRNLIFAWQTVKNVKSNAIVIAKDNQTLGIGAGQVSRIDAVDLAIHKAMGNLEGAVLASDAFFPFRDNIDNIARAGIQAIIQPGGSLRDEEVIEACNEYGIAMVFTGARCFKH
jgi:phosphoribosylaminoimidazolecarboxamide formyltransferase/IMP cyclohydrolase